MTDKPHDPELDALRDLTETIEGLTKSIQQTVDNLKRITEFLGVENEN